MKIDEKAEVVKYLNSLENYQGYVQFSDMKIRECDIFRNLQKISLSLTNGFIYEAHFCNKEESIAVKQINNYWLVSISDISTANENETEVFQGIENLKVRMTQIWEETNDNLCENMKVRKLSKVVFSGFIGDKK